MKADECRIYVASLTDYNAAVLHGVWIEVSDIDTMQEQINAMLAASPTAKRGDGPAEEYAIHDYELPKGIKIGEFESLETVAALGEAIRSHDGAFEVAYANFSDIGEAVKACEEAYQGTFRSMEDFAEDLLENIGDLQNLPDLVRHHIDFEGVARDLEMGGDYWSGVDSSGTLHVFGDY